MSKVTLNTVFYLIGTHTPISAHRAPYITCANSLDPDQD